MSTYGFANHRADWTAERWRLHEDASRAITVAGQVLPPALARLVKDELIFVDNCSWLGAEGRLRELVDDINSIATQLRREVA